MADMKGMALSNDGVSIAVPIGRLCTPQQINERNREFWSKQSALMEQRLGDPDILTAALRDIEYEALRLPVHYQKSFEEALEIAEHAQVRFQRQAAKTFQITFSKKGGAAPKPDALQNLILEIARRNPHITQTELLAELQNRTPGSVVIDIDYNFGSIEFNNKNVQRSKFAAISGLKDRLSRAKKKLAKEEKRDSR
jgi:hypothetical protein